MLDFDMVYSVGGVFLFCWRIQLSTTSGIFTSKGSYEYLENHALFGLGNTDDHSLHFCSVFDGECWVRVRKNTMVELVDELRKLPKSPEIDFMIEEALVGEYHDYKNDKYICGKMESSRRLRGLGFTELAQRIEQGEFDEECDSSDIDMLASDLDENMDPDAAEKMKNILGLNRVNH